MIHHNFNLLFFNILWYHGSTNNIEYIFRRFVSEYFKEVEPFPTPSSLLQG